MQLELKLNNQVLSKAVQKARSEEIAAYKAYSELAKYEEEQLRIAKKLADAKINVMLEAWAKARIELEQAINALDDARN